ncbi:hypothetical protein ZWY2020_051599 [Hordeum vulgare]|nr:hypothetical protein ZWY2020_051599 [Hordeum vulgare]
MPPLEAPGSVAVLSRAIAGCSNRNSVGENAALETLEQVMMQAPHNGQHRSFCCCCCLYLYLGELSFRSAEDADWICALASGTMGKLHGCVLIAGTGSIAYGVTKMERSRAAGAGPVLGDWGRKALLCITGEAFFTLQMEGPISTCTGWRCPQGNKKWDISGEVIKCISKVFPGVCPIHPRWNLQLVRRSLEPSS